MEFQIAHNRKYSKEHVWYQEKDERLVIGISDFLAEDLGEILRVILRQAENEIDEEENMFSIWTSEEKLTFPCPFSGMIEEVNGEIRIYPLPHMLSQAVITNPRRRNVLKDLVRVIQQEHHTYTDPITEFVECLLVRYDFDSAQERLGLLVRFSEAVSARMLRRIRTRIQGCAAAGSEQLSSRRRVHCLPAGHASHSVWPPPAYLPLVQVSLRSESGHCKPAGHDPGACAAVALRSSGQ